MQLDAYLLPFACATFGAVFQEVLKVRSVQVSGTRAEYNRLKKLDYIAFAGLFIVLSAIGAVLWHDGNKVALRDYVILGAAFPLIFKAAMNTAGKPLKLGPGTPEPSSLREVFALYVR